MDRKLHGEERIYTSGAVGRMWSRLRAADTSQINVAMRLSFSF
jgi:hypothetical protein